MKRRVTLDEIRKQLLRQLDRELVLGHEFRSVSYLQERLGLKGAYFYAVALVLERLANDGLAELERPGSKQRSFRRRRSA